MQTTEAVAECVSLPDAFFQQVALGGGFVRAEDLDEWWFEFHRSAALARLRLTKVTIWELPDSKPVHSGVPERTRTKRCALGDDLPLRRCPEYEDADRKIPPITHGGIRS